MDVPRFAIAQYKVTNGEYLDFVRQGARAAVLLGGARRRWFYRGMWQEIPLPLDWPVYVHARRSHGVRALARHAAARPKPSSTARPAAPPCPRNLDFRCWDPIPVDEGAPGHPADGRQRLGVDLHGLRAVPGIRAVSVLPRTTPSPSSTASIMC